MSDSEDFGDRFVVSEVVFPVRPDDKDEPPNSGLSGDAFLAIVIALIGIGGVVFTLDWISRSLLVLCAVGLTIYAARRHSANGVLRILVALIVMGLFIGLSWHPIWEDFHQKYPTAAWPWFKASSTETPPRPQAAPILQSTAGKMILACIAPHGDRKTFEEAKKNFRTNAQIYGDATGLSITLSDVLQGVKVEIQAKTPEAQMKMGTVTKVTIQAQRMNEIVLVTYSWEMPGAFGKFLAGMPLDVNAEGTKLAVKQVEQFLGPTTTCQIS